jgi:thiamine pyrophosphokinase
MSTTVSHLGAVLYHRRVARVNPVLVANAPLQWTLELTAHASQAEPLLAADGGADHLARIGLRPAWVIGDLDSITEATRAWIGEDHMVARPDQDRTDLDKALEFAFDDLGLAGLTVLGALGGRPDHDQANLGLLARLGKGGRLVYVGHGWTALAVPGEATLASLPGETWSFWTYDPNVRVTVEGVRWPIDDSKIDAASRPSISNEAIQHEVRIRSEGGAVIVMRQHDASI